MEAALHDVCKRLLDETMTLERDAVWRCSLSLSNPR